MGRKFRAYLDSGANIHSKYETEIDLDDIGIESAEWDEMSEKDKDGVMKEIAWERMEWGYEEIK